MQDPNLEKIISANLQDIQQGNFYQSIIQARDYLFQITNPYKATKELAEFVASIKNRCTLDSNA